MAARPVKSARAFLGLILDRRNFLVAAGIDDEGEAVFGIARIGSIFGGRN
jgi:hypothetical protein